MQLFSKSCVVRVEPFSDGYRHSPKAPVNVHSTSPPGIAGRGSWRLLLAVLLAAAGPDKGVALAAFIVEEVGVDRRAEARIIQLDRDIIPPFGGAFGPSGPQIRS